LNSTQRKSKVKSK